MRTNEEDNTVRVQNRENREVAAHLQIRRGHVRDGRVCVDEIAVRVVLCREAAGAGAHDDAYPVGLHGAAYLFTNRACVTHAVEHEASEHLLPRGQRQGGAVGVHVDARQGCLLEHHAASRDELGFHQRNEGIGGDA